MIYYVRHVGDELFYQQLIIINIIYNILLGINVFLPVQFFSTVG